MRRRANWVTARPMKLSNWHWARCRRPRIRSTCPRGKAIGWGWTTTVGGEIRLRNNGCVRSRLPRREPTIAASTNSKSPRRSEPTNSVANRSDEFRPTSPPGEKRSRWSTRKTTPRSDGAISTVSLPPWPRPRRGPIR
ncbi:hypothetical protein [Lysobacter gummosus]|uniref:hypothetical protein n=1 Tax=Lysobacter gummosus TaxID=262324 RepID=UPI003639BC5F